MDLVFVFLRNTVAPCTTAELASTTRPPTLRCPRFWAWATPGVFTPEKITTAKAANATHAAIRVRFPFTLPPRPQPASRLRLRCPLQPWRARAVPLQRPRTQFHTHHRRRRRLLPLLQRRHRDCFHIPGSLSWQPPPEAIRNVGWRYP